jgi:squalene cyclase
MRTTTLALLLLLAGVPSAPTADPKDDATEKVDRAIAKGLEFLASTQDKDGSWKAGRVGRNSAITGLAVMAFLSAGHVPGEGKYGEAVEKGVKWVLQNQQPNGLLASDNGHEMYAHGICTLMLAEVAGMTSGPLADDVKKKLEKAVTVILKAQRTSGTEKGGWRYNVAHVAGSDISVTGWQLMSLRAAKNLGCDVPPQAIDDAVDFLKRCYDGSTGGFRYMPGSHVTTPCTGTSILGLELCGKDRHHSAEALKGGAYLLKNPPRWGQGHFFYGIYYCSQAAFQLGDNYWGSFKPQLHKMLLENQGDTGAWYGKDSEGATYGPNYCTAMAILSMTVEYRYLPIYQRGNEATDRK